MMHLACLSRSPARTRTGLLTAPPRARRRAPATAVPPRVSLELVTSANTQSTNTQSAIVMVTNVSDREHAHRVARALVLRRHAAFVNILTQLKSVYRCQGDICREREYVLTIKTLDSEFEAVAATIRELHDDKQPEILAFDIKK